MAGETRQNALPRSRVGHGRQTAQWRIRQRGGWQDARQENHGQEVEEARRARGEGNQATSESLTLEKRSIFVKTPILLLFRRNEISRGGSPLGTRSYKVLR